MRAPLLLVLGFSLLGAGAARADLPDAGVDAGSADAGGQSAHAGGQSADAGGQGDEELRRELEAALQQDKRAGKSGTATAGPAAPTGSAPDAATQPGPAPAAGESQGPLARGSQSLNPDISGIVDADLGYQPRQPTWLSGDDPVLRATQSTPAAGFALQEVEFAFAAVVDPYFKGEIYLTIANLQGIEVEEGFATTTSLPGNLQLKAGSFRSAFGRQNGQHLHVQDFTRRPLINAAFLGPDGLRGPGAQLSWLAPLPFFLTLTAEAFSLPVPDSTAAGSTGPLASFGGGSGLDLTYAGEVKAFFPASDEVSIYAGLSGATGVTPGIGEGDPASPTDAGAGARTVAVGGDLYLKWKPPNVAGGYTSVAWQTEAIFRRVGVGVLCAAGCTTASPGWDGGLYSQLVIQLARRWVLGLRGDVIGLPSQKQTPLTLRGAASLTFLASEFARLRLYGEGEGTSQSAGAGSPKVYPGPYPQLSPTGSFAVFFQLEMSIGAHGAHPF